MSGTGTCSCGHGCPYVLHTRAIVEGLALAHAALDRGVHARVCVHDIRTPRRFTIAGFPPLSWSAAP